MIDPTDREDKAQQYAQQMLGEFLDNIGKTDLAKMTPHEYSTVVWCVIANYVNKELELENAEIEALRKAATAANGAGKAGQPGGYGR